MPFRIGTALALRINKRISRYPTIIAECVGWQFATIKQLQSDSIVSRCEMVTKNTLVSVRGSQFLDMNDVGGIGNTNRKIVH